MPIGGFFGLHRDRPAAVAGGDLLSAWTAGRRGWVGFHNARSAFAWLVRSVPSGAVWLPRYLCADMRGAAGRHLRIYDVDERLQLADPALARDLAPMDMVVAVAHFGAPVCSALRDLAVRRPDVVWVEDRAQALLLDAAAAVPGAWCLYSPRKLLGVHDGGILVGDRLGDLPPPALGPAPPEHADAARLRAEAVDRPDVEAAYRRYVAIERDHRPSDLAMSEATRSTLTGVDPEPLAARRRANFATLDARLSEYAAPVAERLRGCRSPFGYPIVVPAARDAVVRQLAEEGLFCAVHWRDLVEERPPRSPSRRLSETLVTVPLDHRYGADDMLRVADCVRRVLS